jgi:hypothetical protein
MKTKQELLALSYNELDKVLSLLSTRDFIKLNKLDIRLIKDFTCADGCTGVPDFYIEACIIHDFYYRTHKDLNGQPTTKQQADKNFRLKVQSMSAFGKFSPMSWWRWLGLKMFASKAWDN